MEEKSEQPHHALNSPLSVLLEEAIAEECRLHSSSPNGAPATVGYPSYAIIQNDNFSWVNTTSLSPRTVWDGFKPHVHLPAKALVSHLMVLCPALSCWCLLRFKTPGLSSSQLLPSSVTSFTRMLLLLASIGHTTLAVSRSCTQRFPGPFHASPLSLFNSPQQNLLFASHAVSQLSPYLRPQVPSVPNKVQSHISCQRLVVFICSTNILSLMISR